MSKMEGMSLDLVSLEKHRKKTFDIVKAISHSQEICNPQSWGSMYNAVWKTLRIHQNVL